MFALFFSPAEERWKVRFPGGALTASISTSGSIVMTATWDNPSEPIDSISFQISASGTLVQWAQQDFAASGSVEKSATWDSGSAGFAGAGTYKFWATARRVSSGTYDRTTQHIELTVT